MTYSAAVLADDPDVWLRLADTTGVGGTAVDSSGDGHDGFYSNGATAYTQNQAGLLLGASAGTSVLLTGGRINIAHAAWQNTPLDVTIEGIIRWTGSPSSPTNQWIAGKDNAGSSADLSWRIDTNAGVLRAIVYAAGVLKVATSTVTLVAATTYHFAMTHDRSNLKFFIKALDGSTVASTTLDATTAAVGNRTLTSTEAVNIGLSAAATFPISSARLQEFAMYPTALSTARLAVHYNEANNTVPAPFIRPILRRPLNGLVVR